MHLCIVCEITYGNQISNVIEIICFDKYNSTLFLKELTGQRKNFVRTNKMLNKREDRSNQRYSHVLGRVTPHGKEAFGIEIWKGSEIAS